MRDTIILIVAIVVSLPMCMLYVAQRKSNRLAVILQWSLIGIFYASLIAFYLVS